MKWNGKKPHHVTVAVHSKIQSWGLLVHCRLLQVPSEEKKICIMWKLLYIYFMINIYKILNIRCISKCVEKYAALHILSTGRSPCLLNAVPYTWAKWKHLKRTLTPEFDTLVERKGLRGGVGSPGEMTTSWTSSGEVRICRWEEPPGSSEENAREPLGPLTTSARCWTTGKSRNSRGDDQVCELCSLLVFLLALSKRRPPREVMWTC